MSYPKTINGILVERMPMVSEDDEGNTRDCLVWRAKLKVGNEEAVAVGRLFMDEYEPIADEHMDDMVLCKLGELIHGEYRYPSLS